MKKKEIKKVKIQDITRTKTISMFTFCPYCGQSYAVIAGEPDLGHCGAEKCKKAWEADARIEWTTDTNGVQVMVVTPNKGTATQEAPVKKSKGRPKKSK